MVEDVKFIPNRMAVFLNSDGAHGAFIPPDVMCGLLSDCGFSDVCATPLTLGVVTLYTAVKN